jgi:hypothetical protein
MQPIPAGEERAAEPAARPEPPTASPSTTVPPRQVRPGPRLVLRPKVQWMVAGPALLFLALVVVAAGRLAGVLPGLVFAAVGVLFLPALRERIDVGTSMVVQRSWRGRVTTIQLEEVDTLRLRRVPFVALQGLRRGYKFGRFWSVPLTLRLLAGEQVLLELRCGWWNNWQELARFAVTSIPEIDLDGRTRGRLERYVGVPLPASAQR